MPPTSLHSILSAAQMHIRSPAFPCHPTPTPAALPVALGQGLIPSPRGSLLGHRNQAARPAPTGAASPRKHRDGPHPLHFISSSTPQSRVTLESREEPSWECQCQLILLQGHQNCKTAQPTAVGPQVDRWSAHNPETHPWGTTSHQHLSPR